MATEWTTAAICAAMRLHYRLPEWVIVFEVPNATQEALRRADAITMNTRASRGLEVHGFEVKASRADWLSEIANPQKAEDVAAYCDRWWVVGAPDIIEQNEVPRGWGIIRPVAGGLFFERQAEVLSPRPLDRSFIIAILQRRHRATQQEIEAQIDDIRATVQARIDREVRHQVEHRVRVAEDRAKRADELEAALGTPILKWPPPEQLAAILHAVAECDITSYFSGLRKIVNSMRNFIDEVGGPLAQTDAKLKWEGRVPDNEEEWLQMRRDYGVYTDAPMPRVRARRSAK